ncbi:MAG: hypothetical protein KBC30_10935 [Planctomycetes bacterium]|nr:hypothetical protein [Planctomycetota bacterium]
MKVKLLIILFLISCYFSIMGCSATGMFNSYLVSSLEGSNSTLFESENYQLLEEALPSFIILLENAVANDPSDDVLLAKAAEINTFYALTFLEEKDARWASLHYKQAKKYAWEVMKLRYDLQESDIVGQKDDKIQKILKRFKKKSVPDLFWLGMSWGLLINLNKDDVTHVAEFPYVRMIMERVLDLKPDYQNGLPYLFFGAYYGGSSPALGGNPEKGKEYFEKVIALTKGEFLTAKVMYATTYARTIQDRKLYQQLLNDVIDAPEPTQKSFRMGNALAKKQAQDALLKMDEYFVPESSESKEESFLDYYDEEIFE